MFIITEFIAWEHSTNQTWLLIIIRFSGAGCGKKNTSCTAVGGQQWTWDHSWYSSHFPTILCAGSWILFSGRLWSEPKSKLRSGAVSFINHGCSRVSWVFSLASHSIHLCTNVPLYIGITHIAIGRDIYTSTINRHRHSAWLNIHDCVGWCCHEMRFWNTHSG